MTNRVTKFDQKVDAISWGGLVVLWIVAAFFRFVLRRDPEIDGAIGFIGGTDGPMAVFFNKSAFQLAPVLVCTIIFLILTVIIRINPASIPSRIFRYLRFIIMVFVLILYGYMCYSYSNWVIIN